jgi:glutamyl/glutaminyl-tRNA synthetase
LKVSLDKLIDIYSNIDEKDYNRVRIQEILEEQFQANIDTLKKRGNLLWPLRVALSGKSASAGPFEISEILGKQKTLKRILDAKHLYE